MKKKRVNFTKEWKKKSAGAQTPHGDRASMQQPTPSPPSAACRRTSACTSVTRRVALKIICSYANRTVSPPASPCTLTCTGAECTAAMQQWNRQEQRLHWWWSCKWCCCWTWRKRVWLVGSLKQKRCQRGSHVMLNQIRSRSSTHTHTQSERHACDAGVSCAEKHSFLPLQSVHAPLPNPSRGEVAWAQKKHKSVQIYGQAVAGRAVHRDSLTSNENWPESKLWLWRVDGVCCSWSNQGGVSIYDSGSCGRLRQTGVQTDWRTDRRSSSRFSAYLFFQRACQAAEKLLMQTEKASGRYCLILLSFFFFFFHLISKEEVNVRV